MRFFYVVTMKKIAALMLGIALLSSCKEESNSFVDLPEHGTWSHYMGDAKHTHYSSIQQIDTSNVSQLQLAWSYKSGGLKKNGRSQIQTNL